MELRVALEDTACKESHKKFATKVCLELENLKISGFSILGSMFIKKILITIDSVLFEFNTYPPNYLFKALWQGFHKKFKVIDVENENRRIGRVNPDLSN